MATFKPLDSHRLHAVSRGEGVIELRLEGTGPLPFSPAVVAPEGPLKREGDRLETEGLTITVGKSPLTLTLDTPDGASWGPIALGHMKGKLRLTGAFAEADTCYGLGEKPGYLDKRGRSWGLWNTDNTGPHNETQDLMYASIPFWITRHEGAFWGVLLDDPGHTRYDFGHEAPDSWWAEADGDGARVFFIAGPSLEAVVKRYTALTGRMPMPPRWALGFHQSRWGYKTQSEVQALAEFFRTRDIPLDVIHLDIDYMDAYRVFTFHPGRYPDPKALTARLDELGVKAVTIVDPGVKLDPGYDVYDECAEGRLHVRTADGEPFVGEVWPGPCLFPDFSREEARRWWGDRHKPLLDAGIAGIWNDMNEPSVFRGPGVARPDQTMPPDARHGAPGAEVPHRQVHNLYGFYMSQATREGLARLAPETRPFVITRAGYAGIQRHAMVWTGDNHALWSHLEQGLPMCLNLGLSGVAFVGPDVGGFSGDTDAELLVRWTQAGALTPFFRNHSAFDTRRQEVWVFGDRTLALCREAIALRYRLMPYLYGLFQEAATTGMPIMRPMVLAYPDEPATGKLHDQYMLGPDLLAAPVLRPGATHRMVYFPAGRWVDFHTGAAHHGPGFRVVETPITHPPLFLREGAVVPLGPVVPHTGIPLDVLTLRIAPGKTLSGRWYDDDGTSLAYQQGGYNEWRFHGATSPMALTLAIEAVHAGYDSPTQLVSVQFMANRPPSRVTFAGDPVAWTPLEGGLNAVMLPLREGELELSWED